MMRDKRFVAEHRGGTLTLEQHRQLMKWGYSCAEHVLPLLGKAPDERLLHALRVAKEWAVGKVPTGIAMKASLDAHALARANTEPVSVAVARSIGQAVATAHMADHSLGGALYALKAIKLAGESVEKERAWQYKCLQKLPPEIVELVSEIMEEKGISFKI